MQHAMFTAARSRLLPLATLLLATALGGCVGYSSYPSRDYGWVLGRSKSLSEKEYQAILGRLEQQGYDRSRFVKVPQK